MNGVFKITALGLKVMRGQMHPFGPDHARKKLHAGWATPFRCCHLPQDMGFERHSVQSQAADIVKAFERPGGGQLYMSVQQT